MIRITVVAEAAGGMAEQPCDEVAATTGAGCGSNVCHAGLGDLRGAAVADQQNSASRIAESVIAALILAIDTWAWKRDVVGTLCMFVAVGCGYYVIRGARKSGNSKAYWRAAVPYFLGGVVLAVILIILFP